MTKENTPPSEESPLTVDAILRKACQDAAKRVGAFPQGSRRYQAAVELFNSLNEKRAASGLKELSLDEFSKREDEQK